MPHPDFHHCRCCRYFIYSSTGENPTDTCIHSRRRGTLTGTNDWRFTVPNLVKPRKAGSTKKVERQPGWFNAADAAQHKGGSICCKTCYLEHNQSSPETHETALPSHPPAPLPPLISPPAGFCCSITAAGGPMSTTRSGEIGSAFNIQATFIQTAAVFTAPEQQLGQKSPPPHDFCEVRRWETCDISSKRATPAHKHKVVASFLLCRVVQGPLLVARQPGTPPRCNAGEFGIILNTFLDEPSIPSSSLELKP